MSSRQPRYDDEPLPIGTVVNPFKSAALVARFWRENQPSPAPYRFLVFTHVLCSLTGLISGFALAILWFKGH